MSRKENKDKLQIAVVTGLIIASILIYARPSDKSLQIKTVAPQVKEYRNRVLPIQGRDRQNGFLWTYGTGSLVNLPSGFTGILTNAHVCEAGSRFFTTFLTTYRGDLLGNISILKIDPKVDLCLLINFKLLKEKNFSVHAIRKYETGEGIFLLGYPLGGPLTPQTGYYIQEALMDVTGDIGPNGECSGEITFTFQGAVCVVKQKLNSMTTLTYPGNSGSPVFNSDGDMMGVVNSGDNFTHQGNFISGVDVDKFLEGF